MRNAKLTTTRWRFPKQLRARRLANMFSNRKNADLLDPAFLNAIERRRETLESRNAKLLAIQFPMFLMLAFSLLHLDVKVTILGFSTDSAKSLREFLLVVSAGIGLLVSVTSSQIDDLNDVLRAAIKKRSAGDRGIETVLGARFGLATFSWIEPFDDELRIGRFQTIVGGIVGVALILLLGAFLAFSFFVQISTARAVIAEPNYSVSVSIAVLIFVVSSDVVLIFYALLRRSYQPYQTMEDFNRLAQMADRSPEKYDAIIKQIVRQHAQKGRIRRWLSRPRMPKITE